MRDKTPREIQREQWATEIREAFQVLNAGGYDYVDTIDQHKCESIVETIEEMIEAAFGRASFNTKD